jgi:hypothetical protein
MISGISKAIKGMGKAVKDSVSNISQSFNSSNNGNNPKLGKIRVGSHDLEEINLISQGNIVD